MAHWIHRSPAQFEHHWLCSQREATITDQIFEMHDPVVGRMFNEAKRKQEQSFAESGKAINEEAQLYARVDFASIDAQQKRLDPYAAIEGVMAWGQLHSKRR